MKNMSRKMVIVNNNNNNDMASKYVSAEKII